MGQADTTRQTEHPGDVAALERLAGRLRDAPGPVVALTGAGVAVRSSTRDYYKVETEAGWLWLFRDLRGGRWFVQGKW